MSAKFVLGPADVTLSNRTTIAGVLIAIQAGATLLVARAAFWPRAVT